MKTKILIYEPTQESLRLLGVFLRAHNLLLVSDNKEVMELIEDKKSHPKIAIISHKDMAEVSLIKKIKANWPKIEIIIVSTSQKAKEDLKDLKDISYLLLEIPINLKDLSKALDAIIKTGE